MWVYAAWCCMIISERAIYCKFQQIGRTLWAVMFALNSLDTNEVNLGLFFSCSSKRCALHLINGVKLVMLVMENIEELIAHFLLCHCESLRQHEGNCWKSQVPVWAFTEICLCDHSSNMELMNKSFLSSPPATKTIVRKQTTTLKTSHCEWWDFYIVVEMIGHVGIFTQIPVAQS